MGPAITDKPSTVAAAAGLEPVCREDNHHGSVSWMVVSVWVTK